MVEVNRLRSVDRASGGGRLTRIARGDDVLPAGGRDANVEGKAGSRAADAALFWMSMAATVFLVAAAVPLSEDGTMPPVETN